VLEAGAVAHERDHDDHRQDEDEAVTKDEVEEIGEAPPARR
jgi:hypothetical protein